MQCISLGGGSVPGAAHRSRSAGTSWGLPFPPATVRASECDRHRRSGTRTVIDSRTPQGLRAWMLPSHF
eukprot:1796690-Pyramimonas_sp.AAC.2